MRRSLVSPLLSSILLFLTVPLAAQRLPLSYAAKFVCGLRPSATGELMWDAVSPGRYFTAINIRNPGADTLRLTTQIAATRATPVAGAVLGGPEITLMPYQALEVDCGEILPRARTRFLKGFLVIPTAAELDVVAVYTASAAAGVTTIDVETIHPRRVGGCPDLAILRTERPAPTATTTSVTVYVTNLGSSAAPAFDVYVEDPGRTGPERIQTTTVPGLAPGATTAVTVTFPYPMSGSVYMAAIILAVDPKDMVSECREDNNRRTLGS